MKSQIKSKKRFLNEFRNEVFGDKIFDICVWILILLAVCVTLYPFLYVISISISSGTAVSKGEVFLWPIGFELDTYKIVMKNKQLWTSYGNTFIYTVFGTFMNVVFTCIAAYPLSRKQFFLRKKLNFFIAFTMYFSGGLIPGYMVVTGLGLYNSRLAMIIPFLLSTYNVMICRSAMEAIPEDLFENASLEGANDFQILVKIAIPLIKPTLAVLTLYYAVARYNDFFNAMLYLGKTELQPLQMYLRKTLILASTDILKSAGATGAAAAAQSTLKIRYVCIVIATLPILAICPFLQKYLVKGTMLGAVKE
ncbi:carbohydrate ABC transporter permease [Candidatus Galacturonibacter soehngenii]|uniref:Carbohydrate ABC transporter permease n=1 Tax=Candidatus Galacturonatibacter soehngenii TaxID=2307010 RepID=A0A7V7UDG4_9FIRM|nr:carbohydrate ABC transporter permease [Candidatus Galacturonibacter soehngenii]KAB1440506.1 carbohydrate ABC transporter permease [Candidatus Galacturonibacter soehngenii]MBA4687754.1 carbohydrate ABC transporter permease [Candidatus Galacturonibacter soehngenii]